MYFSKRQTFYFSKMSLSQKKSNDFECLKKRLDRLEGLENRILLLQQELDKLKSTFGFPFQMGSIKTLKCPKCNIELVDKQPGVFLSSCPPQKDVVCSQCQFTTRVTC